MIVMMALRNARRNLRRTSLTMATICLGCSLLIIALSWLAGIHDNLVQSFQKSTGQIRISTRSYIDREALLPLEENLTHTTDAIARLQNLSTVQNAYPKLTQGVAAAKSGNEIGEVFTLVVGAPVDYYQHILKLDQHLREGRFFSQKPRQETLIGQSLAKDMGIRSGEEAIFLGKTQDGSLSPIKATVVGIVQTGNNVFDRQAYISLQQARWMANIPQGSTEILLYGPSSAKMMKQQISPILTTIQQSSKALDIDGKPAEIVIQEWNTREPIASLLRLAFTIHVTLAGIIILVSALGVLNTMMMSVLERTKELGILRSLGMPKAHVAILFILEAQGIALAGGLLGAFIGSLASILMHSYGIDLGTAAANTSDSLPISTILYPQWSPMISFIAIILALFMAFFGSLIPAIRAMRVTPVQAMNSQ